MKETKTGATGAEPGMGNESGGSGLDMGGQAAPSQVSLALRG